MRLSKVNSQLDKLNDQSRFNRTGSIQKLEINNDHFDYIP